MKRMKRWQMVFWLGLMFGIWMPGMQVAAIVEPHAGPSAEPVAVVVDEPHTGPFAEPVAVDAAEHIEALPEYLPVAGVAGNFTSIGSDSLANLMSYWGELFHQFYPAVKIQIQATGSSTATTALIEGTADFGPMTREMQPHEMRAFTARYGYPPTRIRVGVDAVAIYVQRENPLRWITLEQLDALFSATRRCGGVESLTHWGQLGVTGPLQRRNIQLYARNSASGTYGFFKDVALCRGDYRARMNEMPGSASVVQAVGSTPEALGYSGIGFMIPEVRPLGLVRGPGEAPVFPDYAAVLAGDYPLSRFVYLYVNIPPKGKVPPRIREFVRLVLSRQGQERVAREGYIPISAAMAQAEWQQLGLER